MLTPKAARAIAALAKADAKASVARESDVAIRSPRYTTQALFQTGWARSFGQSRAYRAEFTNAFVLEWQKRYAELTGEKV